MTTTLLISEKILKSVTLINDNIDGYLLQPAIVLAQEVDLQSIIGTRLLNALKSKVADSSISQPTNAEYKLLLDDYVVPFLCWQTMAEMQVPLNYKLTNSGTIQNQDDKKTAVTMQDLNYIVDFYKSKADFFAKRIADYLCAHTQQLPEYRQGSTQDVLSRDAQYCNIYLGESRRDPFNRDKRKNYY